MTPSYGLNIMVIFFNFWIHGDMTHSAVLNVRTNTTPSYVLAIIVHIAPRCNITTHYNNILQQHTATTHCNNTLQQHTSTTHCSALQLTATHCNTLQHTATCCNTLQHTATHCNTLQHTATHCNALQHTHTLTYLLAYLTCHRT